MFFLNIQLSHTASYLFPAPCQNLEKANDTIPRKHPDRQKGKQALFHRTLPTTARDQKKYYLTQCKKVENKFYYYYKYHIHHFTNSLLLLS